MSCTNEADCSGHGICNEECECYDNYKGNSCESCLADNLTRSTDGFCLEKCQSTCKDKYSCKTDIGLGINLCVCSLSHANPDRDCGYCLEDYRAVGNSTCQPMGCVKDRQLCGNQGTCIDTAGVYSCQCNPDFIGTFCENCINGKTKTIDGQCLPEECVGAYSNECSGFGKCDVISRDCKCDHGYAGRACENCNVGFRQYDNYFETLCLSDNCFAPDESDPCSTNGDCITQGNETSCQCYTNSSGQYCQDCATGFKLLDDGYCLPDVCEVNLKECADNGFCVISPTGYACSCHTDFNIASKCLNCNENFTLMLGMCIPSVCVYDGAECNWHGYCLAQDVSNLYKCICEEGYLGKLCTECDKTSGFVSVDRGSCIQPECVIKNTECSNNGICYNAYAGWQCNCNVGASGPKCDRCDRDYVIAKDGQCVFEDCFSAQLECAGHGYCSSQNYEHKCHCDENFTTESRCVNCEIGYTLRNGKCEIGGNLLSGGAIAGIVIAVVVVVIAICVGIWFGMKGKNGKIAIKKVNNVPKDISKNNKSGSLLGNGSGFI